MSDTVETEVVAAADAALNTVVDAAIAGEAGSIVASLVDPVINSVVDQVISRAVSTLSADAQEVHAQIDAQLAGLTADAHPILLELKTLWERFKALL